MVKGMLILCLFISSPSFGSVDDVGYRSFDAAKIYSEIETYSEIMEKEGKKKVLSLNGLEWPRDLPPKNLHVPDIDHWKPNCLTFDLSEYYGEGECGEKGKRNAVNILERIAENLDFQLSDLKFDIIHLGWMADALANRKIYDPILKCLKPGGSLIIDGMDTDYCQSRILELYPYASGERHYSYQYNRVDEALHVLKSLGATLEFIPLMITKGLRDSSKKWEHYGLFSFFLHSLGLIEVAVEQGNHPLNDSIEDDKIWVRAKLPPSEEERIENKGKWSKQVSSLLEMALKFDTDSQLHRGPERGVTDIERIAFTKFSPGKLVKKYEDILTTGAELGGKIVDNFSLGCLNAYELACKLNSAPFSFSSDHMVVYGYPGLISFAFDQLSSQLPSPLFDQEKQKVSDIGKIYTSLVRFYGLSEKQKERGHAHVMGRLEAYENFLRTYDVSSSLSKPLKKAIDIVRSAFS